MTVLSIILKELMSLFIDDGSLAIGILLLTGGCALILHLGLVTGLAGGGLLFIGLVALLIENLTRSARRVIAERAAK